MNRSIFMHLRTQQVFQKLTGCLRVLTVRHFPTADSFQRVYRKVIIALPIDEFSEIRLTNNSFFSGLVEFCVQYLAKYFINQ